MVYLRDLLHLRPRDQVRAVLIGGALVGVGVRVVIIGGILVGVGVKAVLLGGALVGVGVRVDLLGGAEWLVPNGGRCSSFAPHRI